MNAHLVGSRPVAGASTEFYIRLEDDDTGRILVCGESKQRLPIVRACVVDGSRPESSARQMPPGALETRGNAVYVNIPMGGETLAVVVARSYDPRGESNDRDRTSVYLICQSMTVIDRVGELAEGMDIQPDAERKPAGRREADRST